MAMKIPKGGFTQLLKDGYQHSQGLDEAVYRNIQATRDMAQITRTSLGPNGRNKLVVNHLEKLFVTSDAATIVRELEIQHPAAKLLVMASQRQEAEQGDGTNLVLVLGGELLSQAEKLLRMGLHPSDVIAGYTLSLAKTLTVLDELAVADAAVKDPSNRVALHTVVQSALASKQHGYERFLADLVVDASLHVMPSNPAAFNVDSVRVVKILGGSIHHSTVVKGMVFGRQPEGTVKSVRDAKVAVFTCPLDISQTETKGTVLLHNAGELLDFSKGEERQLESALKELADAGVNVVVTGSGVGELAQHFLDRYNMLSIKVLSKFDLRRLCRVIGATALARLGAPLPEEMGRCAAVEAIEIGSDRCTVFRQEAMGTKTSTIVLRGGTQNGIDDLERAIDDGVNTIKAIAKEAGQTGAGRVVAGAGAAEIEAARRLTQLAEKTAGLSQYAMKAFAQALEVVPRTLAENAGVDATEVLAQLHAAHASGQTTAGVDIEAVEAGVLDSVAAGIVDVLNVKRSAVKLAAQAALTILS
ncbi:T-complex protein 1, partial [Caulochytrium protostelioides]